MGSGNPEVEADSEPQLPPALRAELEALYALSGPVSAHVDDRVLNRARAHFARSAPRRRALRWAAVAAVAAAAVVVLVLRINLPPAGAPPVASAIAGDVDGNGRVDILDALVLARSLESHRSVDHSRVDLNKDGVVDSRDVDAIAMSAVRLPAAGGVQ